MATRATASRWFGFCCAGVPDCYSNLVDAHWEGAGPKAASGIMLDYETIEQVLATQQKAYDLLKWLADAVVWQPHLLVPQESALLHKPESTRLWINKHKSTIPSHLLPERLEDSFVNLFSSFFSTSFRVGHFEFDGKLIDSNIRPGANPFKTSISQPAQCEYLALKHLCNSEKLNLTDKEAKLLVRHKTIQEALLIWTYVWELERRARGKGKGAVVHQIWRNIPKATRESLDVVKVWDCKQQILTAVRNHITEQVESSVL